MFLFFICVFLVVVCVFASFSKHGVIMFFFEGLEEQYERCERQSYQVTEVNLKLFLADFQGLPQVLTYGIFPKKGGGAQNIKIWSFFFTKRIMSRINQMSYNLRLL